MGTPVSKPPSSQSSAQSVAKTHIITKSKQSSKQSQLMNNPQINSLTENINSVSQKKNQIQIQVMLQNISNTINQFKNNPIMQEACQKRKQFGQNVCRPLNQVYKDIPQEITNFKFNLINQYGYKQRLIALGLCSAIVGISAFKRAHVLQIPSAAIKSLKDSAVVYFGLGLIVAPEIYNPLMSQQQ